MKRLTLSIVTILLFTAAYSQYIDGERHVKPEELPGLIKQLNANPRAPQEPTLLLNIGYGYLYKDGEQKADLDTGLYFAHQLDSLSRRINEERFHQESLLLAAMLYMEQKDFSASERLLPAMNDTMRLKTLLSLIFFQTNTAFLNPNDQVAMVQAARYVPEAIELALKTSRHNADAAYALELLAREYRERHQPAVAEKYYLMIEQFTSRTDFVTPARIYAYISFAYNKDGNFHRAMEYCIKAKNALNNKSSDEDVAQVYFTAASLNNLRDKPEEALPDYAFLLANPARYKNGINMYSLLASYCSNLQKSGRQREVLPYVQQFIQRFPPESDIDKSYYHLILANHYKDLDQFASAEKHFLDGIRYAAFQNIPNAKLQMGLGGLYYDHKMYGKAIFMLKEAEKILPNENNVLKAENFFHIAQTEAALGHADNAYNYLLKSKSLSDSAFTVGKARLTDELEAQYESRKKEADLQLKDASIRDLNARRKVTLLVAILMSVIVALLGWLFWSRQRSNKLITQKNILLQQLVKDKSWLLKEMHHRVKNNLHIIVSLLESQSTYLRDDALKAIQHSQARIFSMSLIHQKLYQSDDTQTIDMAEYIPELVAHLKESFTMNNVVHISMDIDHTAFTVEEAVPLGLIINEAVTNSMKYAFAADQRGEIAISLKATPNLEYTLIMADNGRGLPEHFHLNNTTSLGFQLIKGLAEQLHATLQVSNESGVTITISNISAFHTHKVKAMENELREQMAG